MVKEMKIYKPLYKYTQINIRKVNVTRLKI